MKGLVGGPLLVGGLWNPLNPALQLTTNIPVFTVERNLVGIFVR